jgi:hypothetical protein
VDPKSPAAPNGNPTRPPSSATTQATRHHPHLDLKRYHYLVAIITAHGTAPFTICKNRTGEPLTTWPATAGSLVLLRAPGLDGLDDGRPLHTVSGPATGHRISVSYRMDTTLR